jgi:hypothetical protein
MVATQMLRQLAFGALDMHLHHAYDGEEPIFDVQKRMLELSVLSYAPREDGGGGLGNRRTDVLY